MEKKRLKLVVSISSVALSGTLWHDFQSGSLNMLLVASLIFRFVVPQFLTRTWIGFLSILARLASSCYRVELETIFEVYWGEYLCLNCISVHRCV
ncbi:hypothetical protein EDD85DRAFT_9289 [Armillaria nabsnona]|nr:hypothetical protein EDD85DRAFT_9289 [Armillaria nabsnona]